MSVAVGTFAVSTAATTDQSVTGVGFTPKVVWLWTTLRDMQFSYGWMTDDTATAKEATIGVTGTLNSTSTYNYEEIYTEDYAIWIADTNYAFTADGWLNFKSMDTDGFTVNKNTFENAANVKYLALSTGYVSDVKFVTFTNSTASTGGAVTGSSFEPNLANFIGSVNGNYSTGLISRDSLNAVIGWCGPSTDQQMHISGGSWGGGGGNRHAFNYARGGYAFNAANTGSSGIFGLGGIENWTTDGFTWYRTGPATATLGMGTLLLNVDSDNVAVEEMTYDGASTASPVTSTTRVVTPLGLFAFGIASTENLSSNGINDWLMHVGGAANTDSQVGASANIRGLFTPLWNQSRNEAAHLWEEQRVSGGGSHIYVSSYGTNELTVEADSTGGSHTATTDIWFGAVVFGELVTKTLQSIAGTLTFSGAPNPKGIWKRVVTGVLSLAGTISRKAFWDLDVAGVLNLSGAPNQIAIWKRSIEGLISFAGSVDPKRRFKRVVTGVLSFAGSLTRTIVYKILAAIQLAVSPKATGVDLAMGTGVADTEPEADIEITT